MTNTDPIIEKIEADSGGTLIVDIPAANPDTGEFEFNADGTSVYNDEFDTSVRVRQGLENIFELITWPVAMVSGTVTLDRGRSIAFVTSASTLNITLPQADAGIEVVVKNTLNSVVDVTVITPGLETIDGNVNDTITVALDSRRYISDGANWFIVG